MVDIDKLDPSKAQTSIYDFTVAAKREKDGIPGVHVSLHYADEMGTHSNHFMSVFDAKRLAGGLIASLNALGEQVPGVSFDFAKWLTQSDR